MGWITADSSLVFLDLSGRYVLSRTVDLIYPVVREERFGAIGISICTSQLELQFEFPNHTIVMI